MLHIINKSPFISLALKDCLRFAGNTDAILLIEDGVYAALETYMSKHLIPLNLNQLTIYALNEDIYARGLIDRISSKINIIDYPGFVDLTLTNNPIQTWS